MSTRIRLRRMGSKGRPFYRVVVADQRSPRDGRFIENIGRYHPLNDPSLIEIDQDRALHWLRVGAQPSNQVRNLMQKVGIWETFVAERPKAAATETKPERPAREKISKKAQAKAAASEQAAPAAEQAAATEPPAAAEAEPEAPVEAEAEPEAPVEAEVADATAAEDASAEDSAEA
jgi:small subunit ribosomal protein S16